MAAYFRRRAGGGVGGSGSGGSFVDEPYPALLIAGSSAANAGDLEKV